MSAIILHIFDTYTSLSTITTPRPLSGLQTIIDLSVDSSFKAFTSALVKIEEKILHDLKL